MKLREIAIAFSAGAAGGLANSLAVWIFGLVGVTALLGVAIAPGLSAAWLYPRIVWGGIWGFLFALPIGRENWILRGVYFSLGPSFVQMLLVFPLQADKGLLGLDLGLATPVFVLFFNLVWGLTASLIFEFTTKSRD